MALIMKQLGQLRPGNTTAASLYSPAASTEANIKTLTICNTTATAATYRIFVDDNGTTYDETTALFFDISLAGNATDTINVHILMNNSSGNLAVRTGTSSALTFTAFGYEKT